MVFGLLRKRVSPDEAKAETIYGKIVAAARRPEFYADLGAPDSFPGRFELVVVHAALVLRRLRRETNGQRLGQLVFDVMFQSLDANLREIGIGDMAVPKRMKAMVRSFYDGAKAYDEALDGQDEERLASALSKNVFAGEPPTPSAPRRLAAYMTRADAALAAQPVAEIANHGPAFPELDGDPR